MTLRSFLAALRLALAHAFGGLTHNAHQDSSGSAGVSAPLPVFERPGDQEIPRGWDEVRLNPLKATAVIGNARVNIWAWTLPPPPPPLPPNALDDGSECCDSYTLGVCDSCNSLTCLNCCEHVDVAPAPSPPPAPPPCMPPSPPPMPPRPSPPPLSPPSPPPSPPPPKRPPSPPSPPSSPPPPPPSPKRRRNSRPHRKSGRNTIPTPGILRRRSSARKPRMASTAATPTSARM